MEIFWALDSGIELSSYILKKFLELSVFDEVLIDKEIYVKNAEYSEKKAEFSIEKDGKLYDFSIEFAIPSDEKKLFDLIQEQPGLKKRLSLNDLNPAFFDAIEYMGFPLLPADDSQINIKTDIQDVKSAYVAVCNYLSDDIAEDNSVVFILNGINLEKLQSAFTKKQSEDVGIEGVHSCGELPPVVLSKLDTEELFQFVDKNPLFFKGKDFKFNLMTLYETVEDDFSSLAFNNNLAVLRNTDFYFYNENNELRVFISPHTNFSFYLKSRGSLFRYKVKMMEVPFKKEGEIIFEEKQGLDIEADVVLEYFLNFSEFVDVPAVSHSSKFLNYIALVVKEAVKNCYFKPFVNYENENIFNIKYELLYANDEIENLVSFIVDFMPETIAFNKENNTLKNKNFAVELLNKYLDFCLWKFISIKAAKLKPNPVLLYFVKKQNYKVMKGSNNVASALSTWFDSIGILKYQYRPLIRVEKITESEFFLNIDIVDTKDTNTPVVNIKDVFDNEDFENRKKIISEISAQVYILSKQFERLSFVLYAKTPAKINLQELFYLIQECSSPWAKAGIEIIIPKDLKNIVRPKILLQTKLNKDVDFSTLFSRTSQISLDDIMNFSYKVALGDTIITPEEFMALSEKAEGLINYRDKYVILRPSEISSLIKQLKKPLHTKMNSLQLLHSALSQTIDDVEVDYDELFRKALVDMINPEETDIPKTLNGELRKYQVNGFKWLYSNTKKHFGCCIADDMGLGKTIQVLSLLLKYKEENKPKTPSIVVVPTTLIGNWQKECEKFAPSLKVCIYHGLDRKLDMKADLIITSYAIVRMDLEVLSKHEYPFVIIDEAQNIKNPQTAQSVAVKTLKGGAYVAMTGTPIENRLSELWSIFDFLNRGYLGTLGEFHSSYSVPIEREKDVDTANRLKKVTSPFLMRRLKTDKSIIGDLPEKLVLDDYCNLTKEQAVLYEKTLSNTMNSIKSSSGITRKGNILKLITSLKQICNHPAHFTKEKHFTSESSGKAQMTMEILGNIVDNNEKVLLFTQYREMGEILQQIIAKELNQEASFFHGSLSRIKREELISDFQQNNDRKVMILSLKAGGTGLNLTAAANVIHYDLWWNPAVENQATDRTYRIGQTRNVMVHRLITIGTFEEKIDDILKSKQKLLDMSLFEGEQNITELTDKEIMEIFSLRI
mgnify:FL=1